MTSLILGIAIIAGLFWSARGLSTKASSYLVNRSLGLMFGSLLAGRMVYVILHWHYFRLHIGEIPQVWLGGVSGMGAVWGGFLSCLILMWSGQRSFLSVVDRLIYLAGFLTLAGWVNCWLSGCAYGPLANDAWWGMPVRDELGYYDSRFPTQMVGAILIILLLMALEMLQKGKRRRAPGLIAILGLTGLSFELLGLSFLRADPAFYWQHLRLESWGSAGLLLVSIGLLGLYLKPNRA